MAHLMVCVLTTDKQTKRKKTKKKKKTQRSTRKLEGVGGVNYGEYTTRYLPLSELIKLYINSVQFFVYQLYLIQLLKITIKKYGSLIQVYRKQHVPIHGLDTSPNTFLISVIIFFTSRNFTFKKSA